MLQVLEESEGSMGKKRARAVEDIVNKKPNSYTWGCLDIDEFIQKITQEGITDAKVEQVASGYIVHLVSTVTASCTNLVLIHKLYMADISTSSELFLYYFV